MKKEIIGYIYEKKFSRFFEEDYDWVFQSDEDTYSINVVRAIDELLSIWSEDGDKFKITIEKLN